MSSLHLTAAQWRTSKVQLIEWATDTLDMHARMCMCTYTPHMYIWTLLISKDPWSIGLSVWSHASCQLLYVVVAMGVWFKYVDSIPCLQQP